MSTVKKYTSHYIIIGLLWFVLIFVSAWKDLWFTKTITWGMTQTEKDSFFFLSIAFSILIWSLPILINNILFIIIGTLKVLWTTGCLWFFLYFNHYPQLTLILKLFNQTRDLVLTKSLPYYPSLWLTLLEVPFFIALFIFLKKINLKKNKIFILSLSVLFLSSVITGSLLWLKGFNAKNFNNDLTYYGDPFFVRKFGLLTWQIKNLFKKNPILPYSKRIIFSSGRKNYKNIILIQVESLDAGIIRTTWKGKPVTPFLNKLSYKSLYYPAVMSFHKGGGTSDAEFSIINSVEPPSDRVIIMDNSLLYSNSFVKCLKDAGYKTLIFHGNTGKFWNRSIALPRMGYSIFEDTSTIPLKRSGWGIPDHLVFDYALKKISKLINSETNFFCHIITLSSHEPYHLVLNYFTNNFFNFIPDKLTSNFFISMNYVDRCIEKFVNEILKLPDITVIIIGDHAALEMKNFSCSRVKKSPVLLDFVPFFLISSEKNIKEERKIAASFLDIGPTILYISGIPFKIHSDGENLTDNISKRSLISQNNMVWSRLELYNIWANRP